MCVGGEGTAGGTSRRRAGDLASRCTTAGLGGSVGGWYVSRGGRYLSLLDMVVVRSGSWRVVVVVKDACLLTCREKSRTRGALKNLAVVGEVLAWEL